MQMKGKGLFFLLVLVLAFYSASCTQEEMCLSNQHALQLGLYSAYSTTDSDTSLVSATVYGINPGKDSIYKSEPVNKLFLPLSFISDTTAFVIDEGSLRDTIWFRHSKEMKYISRDCGFTYNFKLDSIWFTDEIVDSVAISNAGVNYSESLENVKIYIY